MLTRALEIADKLNDPMTIGVAYFSLGCIHFDKEDYCSAVDSLNNSLRNIEALPGQQSASLSILNYLIYGYIMLEDYQRAKDYAEKQNQCIHLTISNHDLWYRKVSLIFSDERGISSLYQNICLAISDKLNRVCY